MNRRLGCWIFTSLLLAGCGQSTAVSTKSNATGPEAVPETEKLPATVDEVRALRTAGQLDRYERALRLLATSADPHHRGRAEALLGLLYLDQKRDADARPFLERAANDIPSIAPWMLLRIGDAPSLMRILGQHPTSVAATPARLRLAALDPGTIEATNAIRIDELTEQEFVAMARKLAESGREDLATAIRMRLLNEYANGRFTEQTYGFASATATSPLDSMTRAQTLDLANRLGKAQYFDPALDLLARFARRSPAEAATDQYRELRMRSLFSSRHYDEILTEFAEPALRDPAMMLLRARAAWRADRSTDFLAGLKRIERDFPRSAEASDAKIQRAKYHTVDDPKLDIAIDNLQQVIASGLYGDQGENLWTLGWTYLLAKRPDDALRTFGDYKKRFPDGDYLSNSLFWSGKIHDQSGRVAERDAVLDELQATYPYNYFSYRARALRRQPDLAPSEIANGNVFPDLDAQVALITDPRIQTVRELGWLGLYRDATAEMKSLVAANPENSGLAFMLADLYVQGGEPLRANAVLQRRFRAFVRHGGTGIPHRMWEILYPLAYWDVIQSEGLRRNVDPYLIASIIRQESVFEPSTVSNAGAVGIMQIMPFEAARIATSAGIDTPTREQLFDPRINIAVGAAEFAQKRTAMNGNDLLAIAAYNAGEDAVVKWLAQTPLNDGDLFVESIPFNETRLYVKTVTRNRFEYRRIYENGKSSSEFTR